MPPNTGASPTGSCPRAQPPRCSTSSSPSTTRRPTSSPACAGCTPTSARSSPTRSGSPSPTTPAPTAPRGRPPASPRELPGVEVLRPAREGPRPRAAHRLVGSDAAGARLHGRRPVHRPRRAAAAGRAADLRPLRPRDRHPAVARLAGGARPEAGVHLALLQPDAARHPGRPVLRRAVRLQGDPRRRRRSGCCRWCEDTGWFFDTELLVLAERAGLRIHEVPVDWVDDPDSRVDIVEHRQGRPARRSPGCGRALATGALPLAELRAQLGRAAAARPGARACPPGLVGQLVRFAAIGVLSHARLPAAVPAAAGGRWARRARTSLALLVTAVANTAANRRLTFGIRGRAGAARHQLQGLVVFGSAWRSPAARWPCCTRADPAPAPRLELLVLVAANLLATLAALRALPRLGLPRAAAAGRASPTPVRPIGDRRGPWSRPTDDAPRPPRRHRTARRPPRRRPAAPARLRARPRGRRRAGRGPRCWACWPRPALLYLWDLGASGWANSFYSAAVQAGSQSWKAFFFGSLDAGNSITVDKPPASLWLMALSVRIFGLSVVDDPGARRR